MSLRKTNKPIGKLIFNNEDIAKASQIDFSEDDAEINFEYVNIKGEVYTLYRIPQGTTLFSSELYYHDLGESLAKNVLFYNNLFYATKYLQWLIAYTREPTKINPSIVQWNVEKEFYLISHRPVVDNSLLVRLRQLNVMIYEERDLLFSSIPLWGLLNTTKANDWEKIHIEKSKLKNTAPYWLCSGMNIFTEPISSSAPRTDFLRIERKMYLGSNLLQHELSTPEITMLNTYLDPLITTSEQPVYVYAGDKISSSMYNDGFVGTELESRALTAKDDNVSIPDDMSAFILGNTALEHWFSIATQMHDVSDTRGLNMLYHVVLASTRNENIVSSNEENNEIMRDLEELLSSSHSSFDDFSFTDMSSPSSFSSGSSENTYNLGSPSLDGIFQKIGLEYGSEPSSSHVQSVDFRVDNFEINASNNYVMSDDYITNETLEDQTKVHQEHNLYNIAWYDNTELLDMDKLSINGVNYLAGGNSEVSTLPSPTNGQVPVSAKISAFMSVQVSQVGYETCCVVWGLSIISKTNNPKGLINSIVSVLNYILTRKITKLDESGVLSSNPLVGKFIYIPKYVTEMLHLEEWKKKFDAIEEIAQLVKISDDQIRHTEDVSQRFWLRNAQTGVNPRDRWPHKSINAIPSLFARDWCNYFSVYTLENKWVNAFSSVINNPEMVNMENTLYINYMWERAYSKNLMDKQVDGHTPLSLIFESQNYFLFDWIVDKCGLILPSKGSLCTIFQVPENERLEDGFWGYCAKRLLEHYKLHNQSLIMKESNQTDIKPEDTLLYCIFTCKSPHFRKLFLDYEVDLKRRTFEGNLSLEFKYLDILTELIRKILLFQAEDANLVDLYTFVISVFDDVHKIPLLSFPDVYDIFANDVSTEERVELYKSRQRGYETYIDMFYNDLAKSKQTLISIDTLELAVKMLFFTNPNSKKYGVRVTLLRKFGQKQREVIGTLYKFCIERSSYSALFSDRTEELFSNTDLREDAGIDIYMNNSDALLVSVVKNICLWKYYNKDQTLVMSIQKKRRKLVNEIHKRTWKYKAFSASFLLVLVNIIVENDIDPLALPVISNTLNLYVNLTLSKENIALLDKVVSVNKNLLTEFIAKGYSSSNDISKFYGILQALLEIGCNPDLNLIADPNDHFEVVTVRSLYPYINFEEVEIALERKKNRLKDLIPVNKAVLKYRLDKMEHLEALQPYVQIRGEHCNVQNSKKRKFEDMTPEPIACVAMIEELEAYCLAIKVHRGRKNVETIVDEFENKYKILEGHPQVWDEMVDSPKKRQRISAFIQSMLSNRK